MAFHGHSAKERKGTFGEAIARHLGSFGVQKIKKPSTAQIEKTERTMFEHGESAAEVSKFKKRLLAAVRGKVPD